MTTSSLIAKGAIALGAVGLPFAAAHHPGLKAGMNPDAFAKHGAFGTVASINGSIITVTDKDGKTITIDASNASFMKGPGDATGITISDIQIGDQVMAMGDVNDTTVSAKQIDDASLMGRILFGGKVTAVNGSSITIEMPQRPATPPTQGQKPEAPTMTTYTVDLSSASLSKPGKEATTIALSDIKVGDQVAITGTLNGTTVSAKTLSDMGARGERGAFGEGRGMGRGEPGVGEMPGYMGKVTAVNGSTLTIEAPQRPTTAPVQGQKPAAPTMTTYTVNASGVDVSGVKVDDHVAIEGTLDGSTITATSVKDLGQMNGKMPFKGGFGHGMRGQQQGAQQQESN